jgi:sugar phosphate permease
VIKRLPFHYAFVIVVVTFLTLLMASGVRTVPSVLIKPLEADFGWDRTSLSFSVMISLFAFGFGAPIAGTLVDRYGPKRVMLGGLALTSAGLAPLIGLTELWQLDLFWGLVVGVGTGIIAGVIGATVANRWFNAHRGMVLGLFSAAAAAGQSILFPLFINLTDANGWRNMLTIVTILVAAVLIPVVILMRDKPEDVGLEPVGGALKAAAAASAAKKTPLREAIRTRDFWLLAGSFFICGYTTNGLVGTHLLPHSVEHGFLATDMSGILALMGFMNIVGTLASGWLSDRYDNRILLMTYYGLRGLSLLFLPFIDQVNGMLLFAVVYGLDWVATVPPTVNLTAQRFGRGSLGTIYGWIFCAHMIGAGVAAQAGGIFRDTFGDYVLIFLSAGVLGGIASLLSWSIDRSQKLRLQGDFPLG